MTRAKQNSKGPTNPRRNGVGCPLRPVNRVGRRFRPLYLELAKPEQLHRPRLKVKIMICPIQLQQVNAFVDVKIPTPKEFYQRFGFRPQGGYLPNDLPFPESSTTIADCINSEKYIDSLRNQQNAGTEPAK